jgi:hypothetical protein
LPGVAGLDIDRCLDRLDDALRRVGATGLVSTRKTDAVDEISAAIAPWGLPPDLERLWRRVCMGDLVVVPWRMPTLADPAWALDAYRQTLEIGYPPPYGPPLLFPIALAGETRWSVELRSERDPGGTLFSHGEAIHVEYPSVTALVDAFAELIELGAFEWGLEGHILLTDAAERRARDARLGSTIADSDVSNDPAGWPEHWLRSAGIELRDREPLGVTHTIADLVAAAAEGPVEGRIAGRVVRLAHLGDGALAVVDDGTASLEVWCPTGLSPWGPIHRRCLELAVRLEQPPAQASAVRPVEP